MTLRCFISSPYREWPTAASLRAYLRAHGIDVVSSWIDEAAASNGTEDPDDDYDAAGKRNDAEVEDAHVVVALLFPGCGEALEECGYARAKGIRVVYVDHGGRLHLSTRRACNRLVSDWGSLVVELVGFDPRRAVTQPAPECERVYVIGNDGHEADDGVPVKCDRPARDGRMCAECATMEAT